MLNFSTNIFNDFVDESQTVTTKYFDNLKVYKATCPITIVDRSRAIYASNMPTMIETDDYYCGEGLNVLISHGNERLIDNKKNFIETNFVFEDVLDEEKLKLLKEYGEKLHKKGIRITNSLHFFNITEPIIVKTSITSKNCNYITCWRPKHFNYALRSIKRVVQKSQDVSCYRDKLELLMRAIYHPNPYCLKSFMPRSLI